MVRPWEVAMPRGTPKKPCSHIILEGIVDLFITIEIHLFRLGPMVVTLLNILLKKLFYGISKNLSKNYVKDYFSHFSHEAKDFQDMCVQHCSRNPTLMAKPEMLLLPCYNKLAVIC